ncbi:MAG: Alpha-L-fucosidase [Pedosphaera sp.]|nr:Alpha-L-fucosidase [Pedosphaera sp.]
MAASGANGFSAEINLPVAAQPSSIPTHPAVNRAGVARWQDMRFGMFIHWGPVSLTGEEISWSRANSNPLCPNNGPTPVAVYDNLYRKFNPTNFNAADWAGIARAAGMKYMVLTAKHGDGFLLWPSKVDDYNIGATPFHRDICVELSKAARNQGVKLGWYFSPMDWRDPDCRTTNNNRFVAKMQRELRELLSNYGKLDVLWFDTDGRPVDWDPVTTYPLVRGLQPKILINNRLEMAGWEQWAHQGRLTTNEDFYTPEQRIGAYDDQRPWETCMTLGTQWSWKPNDQIKSAKDVIKTLGDCAGGDGNLLLDVGPMPDGRIEPRQVVVLEQVGIWLQKNGESIYGTRGGPWKPTKAVASTRKGNTIYLHIRRWDGDGVELPAIPAKIKSASLLGGGKVAFSNGVENLTITVPVTLRDACDTVVKLKLDHSALELAALDIPDAIKTTASNVYQDQKSDYGPRFAFDGDNETRWATDNGTRQAWIAADFGRAQSVRRVRIAEAYAGRVQKFALEYRDGNEWKTIFTGTTIGEKFDRQFEPVMAREFRLNILDATDGPTISEIELLKN